MPAGAGHGAGPDGLYPTAQPQNGGDAAPTDPTVPAEPDAGYNTGAGEVVQIKGFRSIDIEWVSAVSIVISQCSRISSCAAR